MSVYEKLKAANPSMSEEQLRKMATNMENMGKGAKTIVEKEEEKKEEKEEIEIPEGEEKIETPEEEEKIETPEDVAPGYTTLQDQLKENKELLNSIQSGSANLYEDDEGNVLTPNDFKRIAKENNMSVAEVMQHEQFSGYKQAKTKVIDSNNDGIIDENDEQLSKGYC